MPPLPKRSDQRRRRNSDPAQRVTVNGGPVRPPSIRRGIHPVARRWYKSLADSGQAQFYEPSDWAVALLIAEAIDDYLTEPKAAKLSAILTGTSSLLATEGDRRRMRLELTREGNDDDEQTIVVQIEEYQRRLGS